MAAKNFNLSKQFNESAKSIWEKRVDEHVQFISGVTARRIGNACDGLGVNLKPETREKLMASANQYTNRRTAPREDRDVDDFDDTRRPGRTPERTSSFGGDSGRGFGGDSRQGFGGDSRQGFGGDSGRGGVGSRRPPREETFEDYDNFRPGGGGADAGGARRGPRGGGRPRRDDDFAFDDKF